MVVGVCEWLKIDWGIVVSGIVGFDGGMFDKFVGIVWIVVVGFDVEY